MRCYGCYLRAVSALCPSFLFLFVSISAAHLVLGIKSSKSCVSCAESSIYLAPCGVVNDETRYAVRRNLVDYSVRLLRKNAATKLQPFRPYATVRSRVQHEDRGKLYSIRYVESLISNQILPNLFNDMHPLDYMGKEFSIASCAGSTAVL